MNELGSYLYVDGGVILTCVVALVLSRQLTASHPASLYLVFHTFVFTLRAWGLSTGAIPFLGLTEAEALRALQVGDVLLVTLTLSWLLPPARRWSKPAENPVQLRPGVVLGVGAVAGPIGIYSLLAQGYTADSGLADRAMATSYQTIGFTWTGLMLISFIYLYGFRWYLTVPMGAYLSFMGLQAEGRFRLVLPAILLALIYLDRRGRKLPTLRVVASLAVVFLLFLQLDSIGRDFRTGNLSAETVTTAIDDSVKNLRENETSDQQVFDQYAITLKLSDALGHPQYGDHFLDLLFLPVPRPWWPDKPATNEHLIAISTAGRPLATIGAVFTLPGELYTDFRWPGVLFGGFIIGRLLFFLYERAYATGYGSVMHFFYLIMAALLIQVYRDGLSTLPIFLLVQNLPLVVIIVLSLLTKPRAHAEMKSPSRKRV